MCEHFLSFCCISSSIDRLLEPSIQQVFSDIECADMFICGKKICLVELFIFTQYTHRKQNSTFIEYVINQKHIMCK